MKKWLIVLGMITCLMGLTACGQNQEDEQILTDSNAKAIAENVVSVINQVVTNQAEESYIFNVSQSGGDGAMFESAFESWKSAMEEMGGLSAIGEVVDNSVLVEVINGEEYPTDGVLNVHIQGAEKDADVEIIFEKGTITSITTNVEYTFGENMQKAALNTLLGMGTVFVVLILISVIISCFGIIPKLQAKLSKKSADAGAKSGAVDQTIAQIIEKEELSDDLELVAVISAAIAASEGASSTDGFVVRSIRRAGNKWQRA